MGNMSYCRFRNTLPDLKDCYDNWDENPDQGDEVKARERLLALCIKIAQDYGPDHISNALFAAEQKAASHA